MGIFGAPRGQKGKITFSFTNDVQKLKFRMLFHVGIWFCYSILTYFNIWLFKGHARSQMGLKRIKILPDGQQLKNLPIYYRENLMMTSNFVLTNLEAYQKDDLFFHKSCEAYQEWY